MELLVNGAMRDGGDTVGDIAADFGRCPALQLAFFARMKARAPCDGLPKQMTTVLNNPAGPAVLSPRARLSWPAASRDAPCADALVVSSFYLPEMLALSDRVLVAKQGKVVTELSDPEATQEGIMYAAIH